MINTRMHFPLAALLALMLTASLATAATPSKSPAKATAKRSARTTSTAHPMVLPFIEDDYAQALAKARTDKLPIFVEAWAPW